RGSRPLDEAIDHLLFAGLLERDGELVAVDFHDVAVTEFLVKHPVVQRKFRGGASGFRDQFALDHHRAAFAARGAAGIAPRGKWRLALVKAAAGLSVPTALA